MTNKTNGFKTRVFNSKTTRQSPKDIFTSYFKEFYNTLCQKSTCCSNGKVQYMAFTQHLKVKLDNYINQLFTFTRRILTYTNKCNLNLVKVSHVCAHSSSELNI